VAVTPRLDDFQQRHRWAGFPVAIVYKYADDQGGYLAALITYYGFLSIFPLLLLASSALGVILQGNDRLRLEILDSALSQFPVIGDQLADPRGLQGSGVALVVAFLGSLYGALGVAQATQNAMNIAWAVPRNRRPNPLLSRLRSLLLIATAGIAVLATTVLSAAGSTFGDDALGEVLTVLAVICSVAVNAVVFTLVFRLSTTHPLSLRDALPGAVTAALVWQLLQSVGAVYVGQVVRNASATNGVFAIVLGLIAWIYVAATVLVLCTELNVVRVKRLWPRALMTPFTDDVDLTRGDRHTYTDVATAQRTKDFESVDVSFEHEGQNATARRTRNEAGQMRSRWRR
jgi:membrane protein